MDKTRTPCSISQVSPGRKKDINIIYFDRSKSFKICFHICFALQID